MATCGFMETIWLLQVYSYMPCHQQNTTEVRHKTVCLLYVSFLCKTHVCWRLRIEVAFWEERMVRGHNGVSRMPECSASRRGYRRPSCAEWLVCIMLHTCDIHTFMHILNTIRNSLLGTVAHACKSSDLGGWSSRILSSSLALNEQDSKYKIRTGLGI